MNAREINHRLATSVEHLEDVLPHLAVRGVTPEELFLGDLERAPAVQYRR